VSRGSRWGRGAKALLDTVVQRNALITAIEKARNSAVIAYVLHDNAVIADDALPQIYDKLQALKHRERLDLLLYARGGVTEVCWRLLNLLREYCDHLGVIVGTRVQGPGTLIALGADEIVMGPLSEIGGVEAVRKHPLLPRDDFGQPLPTSLGEIKSLLQFLRDQGSGTGGQESASEEGLTPDPQSLTSELWSALLQQIHPLAIANLQQADVLSRETTRKALRLHIHPEETARIERLVDLFNGGFHSPLYTAGRGEIRETGLPVTYADDEAWSSIWGLVQLYQATLYNDRPDPTTPGAFFRYVCLIESGGRTTGLRQSFTQVEGQERVLQIRWETAIRGPGPSFGNGNISNN
jgi:hypothetical protein